MEQALTAYLKERGEWITHHMLSFFSDNIPKTLEQSMKYSLKAGGKRLRPILLIATIESLGKPKELGLELACAIEMVHTYSLIHDDLPAMDNDDFRRGLPTNHKVFGEGIAILSGDALLTMGFQLISSIAENHYEISPHTVLHLINQFAIAIGPEGMVGGQVLDLEGENKTLTVEELEKIHFHKTGDLIHYAVYAGAVLAGATEEQKAALSTYARNIGLAFQIKDDILDVIGDKEKMGKKPGSDLSKGKSTYPGLMGLELAQEKVEMLVEAAKRAIEVPGIHPSRLAQIADFMINRQY